MSAARSFSPPLRPDPARRETVTVLHVSRVGFVGGAERVMLTLTAGLGRHGFEPVIACPVGGTLEKAAEAGAVAVDGVPLDRMRFSLDPRVLAAYPRAWRAGSASLMRVARERGARLIHVHHPVGSLYASEAARRLKVPLILHLHDGPPASLPYRMLLRRAARDAALVLCVSRAARSVLETAGGDLAKSRVVPNAVDPVFLQGQVSPASDVTGPGPHIGIFGVVEPRKGQDVFVEAAARLADRYPQARFWIVGATPYDDKAAFVRRVEAAIAAKGLTGRVLLTGHRDDVPALIRAMSVVVSASVSHESFGMVLAEALALGTPVVTTAVGGTTEVVTDGATGRVVPVRDPVALASGIAAVLDGDTAEMARAGAADVRARFAPDVFQAEVTRLYREVLTGGSG